MGTQGTGWIWMSPSPRTCSPQGRRRRRRRPDPSCLPHAPSPLLRRRWHRTWAHRRGGSLGFTRFFPRPPRAWGSPEEGGDRLLLGFPCPGGDAVREGRFAESLWPCLRFMPVSGGLRRAPCSPSACRTSPCKPRAPLAAILCKPGFISSLFLAIPHGQGGGKEKATNPEENTLFLSPSLLSPAADVSSSSCSPVRPRYVDLFY